MSKNLDAEVKVDTLLSTGQIPIIDLTESDSIVVNLKKALQEKGIVFLVNHGVSNEDIHTAWTLFDKFCDLPDEIKDKYIRQPNTNHGYVKPNAERFYTSDGPELRHSFNLCTFQEDRLPVEPLPGFYQQMSQLAVEFKRITSLLLEKLAISLDLVPNFFNDNHSQMLTGNGDNETTLRLLYYPPIEESSMGRDAQTTRCGAHCDYGTFTLLSQDSEGGLEAKLPGSDLWQRVGHLPGALLMNSGEILSFWTEQRYPALWHRVIAPPQASIRGRSRHSLAFFCHPDGCTLVSPINQLDSQVPFNPEKVVTARSHVQNQFRNTYTDGQTS